MSNPWGFGFIRLFHNVWISYRGILGKFENSKLIVAARMTWVIIGYLQLVAIVDFESMN